MYYSTINQAAEAAVEYAARSGWDHAIVKDTLGYIIAMTQCANVDGELGRAYGWPEPIGGVMGDPIEEEAQWTMERQVDDLVDRIEEGA